MTLGFEFIPLDDSAIEIEGYYLTVDDRPVITVKMLELLKLNYKEYQNVMLSCDAMRFTNEENKYDDFVFKTQDDIECVITTLKLFLKDVS